MNNRFFISLAAVAVSLVSLPSCQKDQDSVFDGSLTERQTQYLDGLRSLITGSEKAVIIDTMNGFEDVSAVVRTITDLPLILVNTHGHCDHIFGNIYFDEAYMNPADNVLAAEQIQHEEFLELCHTKNRKMPPFRPIYGGDKISLGNLTLKVIALPGHTAGGICLLLEEDRIFFTGDSINHHLWMQLEECLPLSVFLKNLKNISFVKAEADRILHGHAQDFDNISLYDELVEGIQDLITTHGKDDDVYEYNYRWMVGKCRQHPFGENSVICYNTIK